MSTIISLRNEGFEFTRPLNLDKSPQSLKSGSYYVDRLNFRGKRSTQIVLNDEFCTSISQETDRKSILLVDRVLSSLKDIKGFTKDELLSLNSILSNLVLNPKIESTFQSLLSTKQSKQQTFYDSNDFIAILNEYALEQSLQIQTSLTLRCPFEEITPFIFKDLENGCYLLPFCKKAMGIVKINEDEVFLLDPKEKKILSLSQNHNLKKFNDFLISQRVHFDEGLLFYKVEDYDELGISDNLEEIKISKQEAPYELTFEDSLEPLRWANFHFRGRNYSFLHDQVNDNLYNMDRKPVVRLKFFLLLAYCPITVLIRSVCLVVKTIFNLSRIVYEKISQGSYNLETLNELKENIEDFYKVPFYSLQLYAFVFLGLIKPFESRIAYNKLERIIVRQTQGTSIKDPFYSAYCFNPLVNLKTLSGENAFSRLKRHILFVKFATQS
jgi:hypothetical protein